MDERKHTFFDSWISPRIHTFYPLLPKSTFHPHRRLKTFHIFHKLDVEFTPLILIGGRESKFSSSQRNEKDFWWGSSELSSLKKKGKKEKNFSYSRSTSRRDSKSKLQSHFDEFSESFFRDFVSGVSCTLPHFFLFTLSAHLSAPEVWRIYNIFQF